MITYFGIKCTVKKILPKNWQNVKYLSFFLMVADTEEGGQKLGFFTRTSTYITYPKTKTTRPFGR